MRGGDIENDKTLLDANKQYPTITAIYSKVKDEYLTTKPFEWMLGMFIEKNRANSKNLCGDFDTKPSVCKYLNNDVGFLGHNGNKSADNILTDVSNINESYKLIHSKPIGEDTTGQLNGRLKKPEIKKQSYAQHIGGIPSWREHKNYNGIARRFD